MKSRVSVLSAALIVALASTALTAAAVSGQQAAPSEAAAVAAPPPLQQLDFGPFEGALGELTDERIEELDELVIEATFTDLQAAMDSGELTSAELATYYLWRTREYDVDGLQSMLELNPEALEIAAALDTEREQGQVRGPLHGIPISLKGNIGTADRMHTSAGAAAMADFIPDRDATIVSALRDAGAVIIGKANLSEWAGWIHEPAPGFSVLGGMPVNPYDPSLPVLGSSSGSAIGPSANLVAASVGTETSGSLIAPAAINGSVGIHPSLGVVSRDRVIPLTDQTDTPGPIARTVTDAAALLTAIAAPDERDPATADAAELAGTDFTTFLDPDALQGKRIGIPIGIDEPDGVAGASTEDLLPLYEQLQVTPLVQGLLAAGAEVVPVWGQPWGPVEQVFATIDNGLRIGLAEFMADAGPDYPIATIEDVIAFNAQDPERYVPWGQPYFERAAATGLSRAEYEALGAELRAQARAVIDMMMADYELDAIGSRDNKFSTTYAFAGYPAITVQAAPTVGMTFTGQYLDDGEIIGYAYAFEQAVDGRVTPPIGGDGTPADVEPEPMAEAASAGSYDLGDVTIIQPQMDDASGFREMPVRMQGLIAVPPGEGPFPVLLFMHGAYPFCTADAVGGEVDPYPCPPEHDLRQFEGFEELATAWAERGYLTLVPDLSSEFNNGYGFSDFGVRAIQIADAHLDVLADRGDLPYDAADKADLDRLAIAGHSRGGPLAVRYVTDDSAKRSPLALAMLTPAYLAPEAVIPETMPTMLVTAECDGDVGIEGPRGYRREQLRWLRPAPTLFHYIEGGTHTAFSTQLDLDRGSQCKEKQFIEPEAQRDIVAEMVPDFLDLALDRASS